MGHGGSVLFRKVSEARQSESEADKLFKQIDTNSDGKISFDEFVRIFHRQASEAEPS